MKIIVDIPDRQYEYLSKIANVGEEPLGYYERVIMCGTPLPKGHGRLIDADELYDSLIFPNSLFGKAFKEILDDAPTIIEADKEMKHADDN